MRGRTLAIAVLVAGLTTGVAVSSASTPAYVVRTATSHGHATTPVWYHDTVATRVGSDAAIAWTDAAGAIYVRRLALPSATWTGAAVRVSVASLNCNCVDSTGTNPNRHDVPTLVTDPAGRVYAFYGGGTAAQTGDRLGPFFRAAAAPGSVASWLPEQRLRVPGAIYDMQAVRDASGATDVLGQQGHNRAGAGSLILTRLLPGTATAPGLLDTFGATYRTLIAGGEQANACRWRFTPGCDIFVEANLAAGPVDPGTGRQRLYLIWNWAEANLSNSCGDPAGFCNHGLYAAYSDDHARTWHNLAGTHTVVITSAPMRYNDSAFSVEPAATDIGLFKAAAVGATYPGTLWIAYQPGADTGTGSVRIRRWSRGSWTTSTIDHSRAWNNHLLLRTTATGAVILWSDIAQNGNYKDDLAQWRRDPTTRTWHKTLLHVGPNWFLTGMPLPSKELLVWRAPYSTTRTRVNIAIVPTR